VEKQPVKDEGSPEREEKKRLFCHEDGKTYFARSTERLIFFVLTLVMILVAVLAKLGVLG
jgi:hypothetical protein